MNISTRVVLDENQKIWKKQTLDSFKKHKQGALYLATSMGKSFIAKDIIDDILDKDNDAEILWISNGSAMANVKNNIFVATTEDEKALYSNITFLNFELMRTTEKFIDDFEFKKLKLIVIDEVHKSLATKTYLSIRYAIDKLTKNGKTNLLVMTASNVRSSDGKQVFKELVPKLKAGVDYAEVGLSEAIDQNLLCKIHFLNSNLYKYDLMARAIMKKASKCLSEEECNTKRLEITQLLNYLENYSNKLEENLGTDLNLKIQKDYNGVDGDSWIVFYSTVADALNSEDKLRKLFNNMYKHNANIKINIYQYHNRMTKEENDNVNKIMYTKPSENTVNIFVTVMKGVESVHPVNMAGIIMFRNTHSLNLYEQAIGRTTRAKQYGDKAVYVVDVVGNYESVKNNDDYYGSDTELDNNIKSEMDLDIKLRDQFYENIDFSLLNDKFKSLVDSYNSLKDLDNIKSVADKVSEILKDEVGDTFKTKLDYNPYFIMSKHNKSNLLNQLVEIQARFINGEFGRYTYDEKNKSMLYEALYNILGDCLFISVSGIRSKIDYTELSEVADKVRELDTETLNRSRKINAIINKYRSMIIENELPESVSEYLRFYKIDISGKDKDNALIKLAINNSRINDEIILKFKKLCKLLTKADSTGDVSDLEAAYAYYVYMDTTYKVPGIFKAINETFDCLSKVNDIVCVKRGRNLAVSLAKVIKLNDGKFTRFEGNKYDEYIIRIAKEISDRRKISNFETEILAIYNINAQTARFNLESNKLMQFTNINNIIETLESKEVDAEEKQRIASKLDSIVTYTLPNEWRKRVDSIKEQYSDNDKNKEDEKLANKKEIINNCREKINSLGTISTASEVRAVERAFTTAKKNDVSDEEIMATCFTSMYHEYMTKAIKDMAENSLTDDDIMIINGAMPISNNYSEKLMFLIQYNVIDTEKQELAEKLIKGQIE